MFGQMLYTPVGGDPLNVLIGVTVIGALYLLTDLLVKQPTARRFALITTLGILFAVGVIQTFAAYPPFDVDTCWIWLWVCW
jgi:hypothetical protein